jgi:hypothetical protein
MENALPAGGLWDDAELLVFTFHTMYGGRRSARDDPDRINHASPSYRAVSQQVRVQPLESPVSGNSRLKPFGRGEQPHPQVLRYVDYAPVDLYPAVADAEHQPAGDHTLHIDVVRYL